MVVEMTEGTFGFGMFFFSRRTGLAGNCAAHGRMLWIHLKKNLSTRQRLKVHEVQGDGIRIRSVRKYIRKVLSLSVPRSGL